jgi:hypothetical protein
MVRKGRGSCQKLLEGWRVFFVFDLLGLVARVEVILKLASEVDLLKRIARCIITGDFVTTTLLTEI